MSDETEISQRRRELIELIDDLSSRARNGASKTELTTMLETALEEAEHLD